MVDPIRKEFKNLRQDFRRRMRVLQSDCQKKNFEFSRFFSQLRRGDPRLNAGRGEYHEVEGVRALLTWNAPQAGFQQVVQAGYPELTVEHVIVNDERWHPLFSGEDLAIARTRLEAVKKEGG